MNRTWTRNWNSRAKGTGALALLMILTVGAMPAKAGNLVTNGSFDTTGVTASFSINNPTVLGGWTAATGGSKVLDCLVFAASSTNMCGANSVNSSLTLWRNPGASPDGGNYVMIDGDSGYGAALTQQISGLTAGHQYTLTFYQAAGQQNGYNSKTGAISMNWSVTFGTTQSSATMSFAQGSATNSYSGWAQQTMTFTAASTSQLLSFLAVGPAGAPPFLMLDGVSLVDATTSSTPEPTTMALIGLGLIGVPMTRKLRRKR